MNRSEEDEALALIFANTRRKKRTADLMTLARAFERLVGHYGSQKAVADKVGLSSEMVREFRLLLRLPKAVQNMIRARKIDRLDVAYRIALLDDPSTQLEMARQVGDAGSQDTRDIVRLLSKRRLPVKESKKAVLRSKLKGLHLFVIDFDEDQYHTILGRARAKGVDPAVLVQEVVLQWLRGDRRGKAARN